MAEFSGFIEYSLNKLNSIIQIKGKISFQGM